MISHRNRSRSLLRGMSAREMKTAIPILQFYNLTTHYTSKRLRVITAPAGPNDDKQVARALVSSDGLIHMTLKLAR
jgi:hypothetical protein